MAHALQTESRGSRIIEWPHFMRVGSVMNIERREQQVSESVAARHSVPYGSGGRSVGAVAASLLKFAIALGSSCSAYWGAAESDRTVDRIGLSWEVAWMRFFTESCRCPCVRIAGSDRHSIAGESAVRRVWRGCGLIGAAGGGGVWVDHRWILGWPPEATKGGSTRSCLRKGCKRCLCSTQGERHHMTTHAETDLLGRFHLRTILPGSHIRVEVGDISTER